MSKFFVEKTAVDLELNRITIIGDDVKHIKNVLRMSCGDNIIICDGCKMDYEACIESIEKDKIVTSIIATKPSNTEPPIDVTLFQGLPKSDKMDLIIQKCVELGIKTIVPVITERSVVKISSQKDAEDKLTRWRRICLEASKQCDRGIIPEIKSPIKFNKALEEVKNFSINLIPYENEKTYKLNESLHAFKGENPSVSIFIGPEGGFSDEEIKLARLKGINSVSLGPRILRTETAGIVVLSIIMNNFGDIGR